MMVNKEEMKNIDWNRWEEITHREYFDLEGKKELLRIQHDKASCGSNIYFKRKEIIEPEIKKQIKHKKKRITDEDGITYEEVDYKTYLASGNLHRIVKSLDSRYFVEIDALEKEGEQ